jgi:hypothetical protein
LDIQPSVLEAARAIAATSRRSIGSVISDLALRGMQTREMPGNEGRHPVFAVPPDAQLIDASVIRSLIENDGLSD